jgi:choline dehydrogenase-like flavoprotein
MPSNGPAILVPFGMGPSRLSPIRISTGDSAWNYEAVLKIYRRIEDWHGVPDPERRGTGGLLFIQPWPGTDPVIPATFAGVRSIGIPIFDSSNGAMMEGEGGCALPDMRIRNGQRLSIFRSYTFPYMDRPNLTVLTDALVTRLMFSGTRASGVEVIYQAKVHRIGIGTEAVLSLGATAPVRTRRGQFGRSCAKCQLLRPKPVLLSLQADCRRHARAISGVENYLKEGGFRQDNERRCI